LRPAPPTRSKKRTSFASITPGARTPYIGRRTTNTFATDGICTHEHAYLSDGLVMDDIIECPKHNGRFDYKTGEAKGAPVCVDLKTYQVKVEDGKVLIDVGG
jgi:MocE subfamily Rieske [2Fe-2S] domain protein